jgi:hypothetical protein
MWMAVGVIEGKLSHETARLFSSERSARHYAKQAGPDWRALRVELTVLNPFEIIKPEPIK